MTVVFSSAEVTYGRSYGQHDFTSVQGDVISVLSEPNWEAFVHRLATAESLGDYAVSPELITSPASLEAIPAMRTIIEDRIAQAQNISAERPDTTVVLGTATFNNPFGRPANSQIYMRGGELIGQTNKRYSYSGTEKSVFTFRPPLTGSEKPISGVAGLICSDILGESQNGIAQLLVEGSDAPNPKPIINHETLTAICSTCFAVPIETNPRDTEDLNRVDPEVRYRMSLEGRVVMLFRKYTHLQEVIVADRVPSGSTLAAPLNAHFTRLAATES